MTGTAVTPTQTSNETEDELVERLLSERLLAGFVLMETACPVCQTPLVKQEMPEESDESHVGSMQSNVSPICDIPFCVRCPAHVITDESQVAILEQEDLNKLKGSIHVAIPKKLDDLASPSSKTSGSQSPRRAASRYSFQAPLSPCENLPDTSVEACAIELELKSASSEIEIATVTEGSFVEALPASDSKGLPIVVAESTTVAEAEVIHVQEKQDEVLDANDTDYSHEDDADDPKSDEDDDLPSYNVRCVPRSDILPSGCHSHAYTRRDIATRVLGAKMIKGYLLLDDQCSRCGMPMMERTGSSQCVVCPVIDAMKEKESKDDTGNDPLANQKRRLEEEIAAQRAAIREKKDNVMNRVKAKTSATGESKSSLATPKTMATGESKSPLSTPATRMETVVPDSDQREAPVVDDEHPATPSYQQSLLGYDGSTISSKGTMPSPVIQMATNDNVLQVSGLGKLTNPSLSATEPDPEVDEPRDDGGDEEGSVTTEEAEDEDFDDDDDTVLSKLEDEALQKQMEAEQAIERARLALEQVESARKEVMARAIASGTSDVVAEVESIVQEIENDLDAAELIHDQEKEMESASTTISPESVGEIVILADVDDVSVLVDRGDTPKVKSDALDASDDIQTGSEHEDPDLEESLASALNELRMAEVELDDAKSVYEECKQAEKSEELCEQNGESSGTSSDGMTGSEIESGSSSSKQRATSQEEDSEGHRDRISREIGKKMLKGWELLDLSCPRCVMPLMLDPQSQTEVCMDCGVIFQRKDATKTLSEVAKFAVASRPVAKKVSNRVQHLAPRSTSSNSQAREPSPSVARSELSSLSASVKPVSSGRRGAKVDPMGAPSGRSIALGVISPVNKNRLRHPRCDPPALQGYNVRKKDAIEAEESRCESKKGLLDDPSVSCTRRSTVEASPCSVGVRRSSDMDDMTNTQARTADSGLVTVTIPRNFDISDERALRKLIEIAKTRDGSVRLSVDTEVGTTVHHMPSPGMTAASLPQALRTPLSQGSGLPPMNPARMISTRVDNIVQAVGSSTSVSRPRVTPESMSTRSRQSNRSTVERCPDQKAGLRIVPSSASSHAFELSTVPGMEQNSFLIVGGPLDDARDDIDNHTSASSVNTKEIDALLERIEETKAQLEAPPSEKGDAHEQARLRGLLDNLASAAAAMQKYDEADVGNRVSFDLN